MVTHNVCFYAEIRIPILLENYGFANVNHHFCLKLSMLGKNFSRRQFEIFFAYFSQKIGFDISCKLSPEETICIKCQSLFFGGR